MTKENDKVLIDLIKYEQMLYDLSALREENEKLKSEKLLLIEISVCEWGSYFSNISQDWSADPSLYYPAEFSYTTPENMTEEIEKALSKYGKWPKEAPLKEILNNNKSKDSKSVFKIFKR
jgi:hypothetical protein